MISHDEALSASLEYFGGDQLAADVFVNKYALRNENGELVEKTPEDMHRRLAREFARIEAKYPNPMGEDEIFELLSSWKVVPQGSPMAAIGDEHRLQSLSNCFVVELHDSYGGILKADQELVQIMKRRGGVGLNLSPLRPRGVKTRNAARTTDGIRVFMDRFSNSTREVAQGGRRGALMLTLSCAHPEIVQFIEAKKYDKTKVTGANVSVMYSDEFMHALEKNEKYEQRFPVDKKFNSVQTQLVNANDIWKKTVDAAWASAEPGVLFEDTILRYSPADCYADVGFNTICVNPCSEISLCAYDSCRLLLVNLSKFVKHRFTSNAFFDYDEFSSVVVKAQRLMDDLVDLELEAIDRILTKIESDPEPNNVKRTEIELWLNVKDKALRGRRTGLGITALGDTIAYMNKAYGTDSIDLTSNIYKELSLSAYRSSIIMAEERGAFPIFDSNKEQNHPFLARLFEASVGLKTAHEKFGRRNIALLTTSPAGSVSVLTQTTSGCEPVVFISFKRRRKVSRDAEKIDFIDKNGDCWQEYICFHKGVSDWMTTTGNNDITQSPYHGSTCNDVSWQGSIDVQAAAQIWVDHAIAKTINLPRETSPETVDLILRTAWKKGLKGITVYRDGCRDGVILKAGDKKEAVQGIRPKEVECEVHRANVKGEAYTVLVGLIDGKPYEIFAGLSQCIAMPKKVKKAFIVKNGKNKEGVTTYNLRIPIGNDDFITIKDIVNTFDNALHSAWTRLLSLSLRKGVDVQDIVEQIKKDKNSDVTSFASVVARVLKQYIPNGKDAGTCENCGGKLVYQDGCIQCSGCGWSKC